MEKFKEIYINDNYKNINFNIEFIQKLYTKCLLLFNEASTYNEAKIKFSNKFKNIEYSKNENQFVKLKNEVFRNANSQTLEDVKINNNNNINIDMFKTNVDYKNSKNEITKSEENINNKE